jgi:hypothetical protein
MTTPSARPEIEPAVRAWRAAVWRRMRPELEGADEATTRAWATWLDGKARALEVSAMIWPELLEVIRIGLAIQHPDPPQHGPFPGRDLGEALIAFKDVDRIKEMASA